ncbi:hypothetical protein SAMN05443144_109133 [Fodinibius roseus]|uniref:Uncharacterized protein n=1 Tax=Fodinibius roseus TaxID=1194090 RepID=A0A1M5C875_9BACT|nr:hypothetical protein [Fodinibius roseus]SHF50856.1 hypothetical protein SAMN05443144_109133 [Fodinibius roseus]
MHFDAQTMWSTNNNNTFKGTGVHLDSVQERFSLGDSLWFENGDGYLGNLQIADTLSMGAAGQITNTNNDYSLDEDGLSYQVPDDTLDISKSVTWENGGSVVAQIGAAHDTTGNFDLLEYNSGLHSFKVNGNQIIGLQDNLAFFNKPPVVPRLTDTERDNLTVPTGSIIFNTDANRFQGMNLNGNWKDLSQ